jgi:hypothetical protein
VYDLDEDLSKEKHIKFDDKGDKIFDKRIGVFYSYLWYLSEFVVNYSVHGEATKNIQNSL